MVESLTKDSNRATIVEFYNKVFKQGHYGGNVEQ